MAEGEERAAEEVEAAVLRKTGWADSIASLGSNLFRWGGLVLIARYAFLSIEALAGTTTVADFGLGLRMFAV